MVVVAAGDRRVCYGVETSHPTLPAMLVALLVGVARAVGAGVRLRRRRAVGERRAADGNAIVLPLYFISGIFVPADQTPAG